MWIFIQLEVEMTEKQTREILRELLMQITEICASLLRQRYAEELLLAEEKEPYLNAATWVQQHKGESE